MKGLSVSHLLGIKYLTKTDIDLIFETANHFKEVINRPIKKIQSFKVIYHSLQQLFYNAHIFSVIDLYS